MGVALQEVGVALQEVGVALQEVGWAHSMPASGNIKIQV